MLSPQVQQPQGHGSQHGKQQKNNNKQATKQNDNNSLRVKYLLNKAFLISRASEHNTVQLRGVAAATLANIHIVHKAERGGGWGITVSFRSGRVRRGNFFSATDGRLAGWMTGRMEADKKAAEEAQLAEVRSGIHRQQLQSAVTAAAAAAATAKPPSPAAAGHRPRVAPRTWSRRATVGFGPKLNVAFCIRLQSLGVPLEMRDKTRESSRQAPAR